MNKTAQNVLVHLCTVEPTVLYNQTQELLPVSTISLTNKELQIPVCSYRTVKNGTKQVSRIQNQLCVFSKEILNNESMNV